MLVSETQIVARLLLERPDAAAWKHKIEVENVLQTRSVNTAITYAGTARMRLETMDEACWQIVAEADRPVATQAILACTLRYSPLLAEFMRTALADEYRRMNATLEDRVWRLFFDDMTLQHPNLARATESTQIKLRQNAYRILVEADYLSHGTSRQLQHVRVFAEVKSYLANRGHQDILAAMECAQ